MFNDPIFRESNPFKSAAEEAQEAYRASRIAEETVSAAVYHQGFYSHGTLGRLVVWRRVRRWIWAGVAFALVLIGLSFRIAYESHRIAVEALADDRAATEAAVQLDKQLQASTATLKRLNAAAEKGRLVCP